MEQSLSAHRIVIAVTGASGALYARAALARAASAFSEVHCIVSSAGREVIGWELQQPWREALGVASNITFWEPDNLFAPPASGSWEHTGMLVIPCTVGTAGRVAHCTADSLIPRAADVCLKERRPLVLCLRETPLHTLHLRMLASLSEAGAIIMPASPAFYSCPADIDALAQQVAARALEPFGVPLPDALRWNHATD